MVSYNFEPFVMCNVNSFTVYSDVTSLITLNVYNGW